MPRMNNRVLAINQINTPNQAEKNPSTFYRNKYGDTITYVYHGLGVINGKYFNRCTAVTYTKDKVKITKSFEAARNFINRERKEQTIFGEAAI